MKYLKDCSFHVLLVLLLMIRGSLCVPALDAAPPAATPNTVEESENLVEGSGEPVVAPTDVVPAASNDTTPPAEGNSEAAVPDNVASGSSIDPTTIYAGGLLTPEAFQQYLSQYGAYAPYSYPAPVAGTAAGIYPYPGPIVVQTGYEGFLVPTNTAGQSDSTTVLAPTAQPNSSNPLMTFVSNLLPTILMSTLFRIAAVVVSAVGIILFGGAITSALCRITPICEIPARAVNILRTGGAQDVGRMLAEEMTPERVRRATEFVRNAIRKYKQLQKLVEASEAVTELTN
uniref:CG10035 protein n=1 Tax=Drosophila melanogaster TaxID=7227 RepID=A0AQ72_DROME|nr:CG10035 [Drosophila melanogaster]CAL26805.1 CG10035 [Drosophila melanogaster]CAR93861.1 CG10035-PA [Drosophila melanogaster]CAR93862.1 CG10035-PA [Drosophila melanogaster]CAR93863.1 CG10035-PA [Drosophila melanogaster]